ncbi:Crp/Fnr family transcriptional regulator [Flavobacterium algicola]|uniref:Crp/Fnr family transcriptional regulator n=1 Tax=Flavobacterium algicola TaxID=556529 RepID=UPI001EFDDA65|nr:Crp/Fnr family transcriptional regulator [Flavobacterium algicola]MCG9794172.1 Crp/Fnr family transcriptional regulator [Flavobacterium algicola]
MLLGIVKRESFYDICTMQHSINNHVKKHISATENDLVLFNNVLNEVTIAKGAYLLQPGHHVTEEFFVVKGCLKAYYMDNRGNKHIIQFAVENWWVGDFDAFYNEGTSSIYIEAVEDSQLLSIESSKLNKVFEKAPIFERYFRILVTEAFISQRKRILSAQEKNTQERYVEFCTSYSNIENRVANYDIANYLGVSPENLSRVRQKLKIS